MGLNRSDIDDILQRLSLYGHENDAREIAQYLDTQDELMKTYRGEVPLFGGRR